VDLEPVKTIRSLKGPVKELILVDTSWCLYRFYHAFANLSATVDGKVVPTGDIYGFLRLLTTLSRRKPFSCIVLCIDSKDPDRQKEEKEYKAGRESKPEVYEKLPEIIAAASLLPNVFIAEAEGKEADDLMFSLALKLAGSMQAVYIHSGDNDLMQAVRDNIFLFRSMKNRQMVLMGREAVLKKFNVQPEKLPLYRSIAGDTSDNLRGYDRFPRKLLVRICEKFSTPDEFIEGVSSEKITKAECSKAEWSWVNKVVDAPEVMIKNYGLMKLEPFNEHFIARGQGSWLPIQKYQMSSTEFQIQALLKEVG